ncbi:centromere protein C-like [Physella acuta]|uniref:centromere protein C-like n=1 Tax=Physella acuta TaxID=109671 RepID=UPI0027DDF6CB|nr:centromere protein C-like [Physella acuta]
MEPQHPLIVNNPFHQLKGIGRRTGKLIVKKKNINAEDSDIEDYFSGADDDESVDVTRESLLSKEKLESILKDDDDDIGSAPAADVSKNKFAIPLVNSAKQSLSEDDEIRVVNPFAWNPRYGRRTGKDLLAGKEDKNMSRFSDFFTDNEVSVSMLPTPKGSVTRSTTALLATSTDGLSSNKKHLKMNLNNIDTNDEPDHMTRTITPENSLHADHSDSGDVELNQPDRDSSKTNLYATGCPNNVNTSENNSRFFVAKVIFSEKDVNKSTREGHHSIEHSLAVSVDPECIFPSSEKNSSHLNEQENTGKREHSSEFLPIDADYYLPSISTFLRQKDHQTTRTESNEPLNSTLSKDAQQEEGMVKSVKKTGSKSRSVNRSKRIPDKISWHTTLPMGNEQLNVQLPDLSHGPKIDISSSSITPIESVRLVSEGLVVNPGLEPYKIIQSSLEELEAKTVRAKTMAVPLDFGGDITGSVSNTEKVAAGQFFGIKKRLSYSVALAGGDGKTGRAELLRNSNKTIDVIMDNQYTVPSPFISLYPKRVSEIELNRFPPQPPPVSLDTSTENFCIVDENIIVATKHPVQQKTAGKTQRQRKKSGQGQAEKNKNADKKLTRNSDVVLEVPESSTIHEKSVNVQENQNLISSDKQDATDKNTESSPTRSPEVELSLNPKRRKSKNMNKSNNLNKSQTKSKNDQTAIHATEAQISANVSTTQQRKVVDNQFFDDNSQENQNLIPLDLQDELDKNTESSLTMSPKSEISFNPKCRKSKNLNRSNKLNKSKTKSKIDQVSIASTEVETYVSVPISHKRKIVDNQCLDEIETNVIEKSTGEKSKDLKKNQARHKKKGKEMPAQEEASPPKQIKMSEKPVKHKDNAPTPPVKSAVPDRPNTPPPKSTKAKAKHKKNKKDTNSQTSELKSQSILSKSKVVEGKNIEESTKNASSLEESDSNGSRRSGRVKVSAQPVQYPFFKQKTKEKPATATVPRRTKGKKSKSQKVRDSKRHGATKYVPATRASRRKAGLNHKTVLSPQEEEQEFSCNEEEGGEISEEDEQKTEEKISAVGVKSNLKTKGDSSTSKLELVCDNSMSRENANMKSRFSSPRRESDIQIGQVPLVESINTPKSTRRSSSTKSNKILELGASISSNSGDAGNTKHAGKLPEEPAVSPGVENNEPFKKSTKKAKPNKSVGKTRKKVSLVHQTIIECDTEEENNSLHPHSFKKSLSKGRSSSSSKFQKSLTLETKNNNSCYIDSPSEKVLVVESPHSPNTESPQDDVVPAPSISSRINTSINSTRHEQFNTSKTQSTRMLPEKDNNINKNDSIAWEGSEEQRKPRRSQAGRMSQTGNRRTSKKLLQIDDKNEDCTTPLKLRLLSSLPNITPKSGVSFRHSRYLTSSVLESEEKTPKSIKPNTPITAGLTSCIRDTSSVKPKRKGRKVRISEIIDQHLLSPTEVDTSTTATVNNTTLMSMNSSPVHYAETTGIGGQLNTTSPFMVLPDLSHKIVQPESPPFPGLRRSRRTRVKRLASHKGEGIIYRRDSTGYCLVVDGVQPSIGEAKVKAKEEKRKKKLKERKLKLARVPLRKNKRLSTHMHPTQDVTLSTDVPIIDPDTQENVVVEVLSRFSDVTWFGPSLEPVQSLDSLAVGLKLQHPGFSTGEIHIRALSEKEEELATRTLIFHVINGKICVIINQVSVIVETRDDFCIPRGSVYSLKNLRRDVAELQFTEINDVPDVLIDR